jgi:hypothetical protein
MSVSRRVLIVSFVAGCASGSNCPASRTCGDARWLEQSVAIEGRYVRVATTDAARAGAPPDLSSHEGLSVSPRPTFLRFDLASLTSGSNVERAVLALAPHPAWRPGTSRERILVRAALSGWSVQGVASGHPPAVSAAPEGDVTLPSGVRAPVRIDVTALVRGWVRGSIPAEGLSLETTDGEAVFIGPGALARADRPRLEVVLR